MRLKYEPTGMVLHTTRGCNLSCRICYAESGRKFLDKGEELTFQEMVDVTTEFAQLRYPSLGIGYIGLSGGEPTLRFSELIKYMEHMNSQLNQPLPFRLITNAGLIGATGAYKENNRGMLERAGLYGLKPHQAVEMLTEHGLSEVTISIDLEHTSLNGDPHKVPIKVVCNAIEAFLSRGYGREEHEFLINSTFSPKDYDKTMDLISKIAQSIGGSQDEEGNIIVGDQKIVLRMLKVNYVGNLYGKDSEETLPLDDIFSFQCRRRSEPLFSEFFFTTYWQDTIGLGWDGTVYICPERTFPIGNIREDTLSEILRRLHAREDHPKYGRQIEIVHIYQALSARRSSKNTCVGECLRLIHQLRPDLVERITSDFEACYTLGRNIEMQKILIREFHAHRDELLAKIAEIDRLTEQELKRQKRGLFKQE